MKNVVSGAWPLEAVWCELKVLRGNATPPYSYPSYLMVSSKNSGVMVDDCSGFISVSLESGILQIGIKSRGAPNVTTLLWLSIIRMNNLQLHAISSVPLHLLDTVHQ